MEKRILTFLVTLVLCVAFVTIDAQVRVDNLLAAQTAAMPFFTNSGNYHFQAAAHGERSGNAEIARYNRWLYYP